MTKKKAKKKKPFKIPLSVVLLLTILLGLIILLIAQIFPFFSEKLSISKLKPGQASKPLPTVVKPTPTPTPYAPRIFGNRLKVPILLYHYISDNPNPADTARDGLSVGPVQFEEEMRYLKDNGYTSMSLDSLYPAFQNPTLLPPKPILITADDGYIDFYLNAFPILKKYQIHATVFIPTNLMNQGYYLSWDQIREMSASGFIHFGSHTVHHSHLPSISRDALAFELKESKKILQDQLGIPVNFFAYPYGAVNQLIIDTVKEAGYLGAIGTWPNKIQSEGTVYDMPRLKVGSGTTLNKFIELLQ